MSWPILLVVVAALLNSSPINADMLTLYAGQGIDTNLPNFPGKVLNNDLLFEKSYFSGVSYIKSFTTPDAVNTLANFIGADHATSNIESILVKHHGLQDNYETDVAYLVHLPPGEIGDVSLRFGFAVGLSYAFGNSSYEDGPKDDPEKRFRLQNFNAYELEWRYRKLEDLTLVTRIHHRSGMYGLVAPRHVGSNFITVGLRFTLD